MAKKAQGEKKPDDRKGNRHAPNHMIRVPADIYEALSGLAQANDRPVSREVQRALLDYLARHGRAPVRDDTTR